MGRGKFKTENINRYGLTPKNIPTLEVNRSLVNEEQGFWRNDVVKAWCISGTCGVDDYPICDANEYWLGVYDKPRKNGKTKIGVFFSSCGGMCDYKFDRFFDPADIETKDDYDIQYQFIQRMNRLIDEGVFTVPWLKDKEALP